MKNIYSFLFLIIAGFSGQSVIAQQSAYYDAAFISNHCFDNTNGVFTHKEDLYTVLKKYYPTGTTFSESELKKNPFFKPYVPVAIALSGTPTTYQDAALSSIGGLDVTNIADGFAQFIVKRTKEELNISFFSKFKNAIDSIKDLKTVFPETYTSLNLIGDEIYNYNSYLQTLQQNFQDDINKLPDNLPSIIDNHPAFFNSHPELTATLKSSLYLATAIRDKVHPGDAIGDFPSDYLDSLKNKNIKGSIQLVQLFSEALRDTAKNDSANYWVSKKQVTALLKNDVACTIFLGLIYQRAHTDYGDIQFSSISFDSILRIVPDPSSYIKDASAFISQFADKTNRLTQEIKAYQKPKNDSVAVEQFAIYYTYVIDLIRFGTNVYKLVPPIPSVPATTTLRNRLISIQDSAKQYFDVAQSSGDLIVNINRKKYPAAIASAVSIMDLVLVKIEGTRLDKIINANNGESANAAIQKTELAASSDTLKTIFKFGTFIASVASAKSSDDMETAIENFALPSGSSRIKRETPFNVSLNAYCGLFAGYEQIQGLGSDRFVQINSYGVTAPVGISISTGQKQFLWMGSPHWSYSAFISVFDLGAVAAFRFNNDTATTSQIPKIQLKDIISPGLLFSIGIPKCPLSVNLGAQMGPNLRNVSTTGNDLSNNVYWRYSASLVVDIPVLNLYTKSAD